MIQTEVRNSRGDLEKLDHHDPRYWEGPYRKEEYPKGLYRQTTPGQVYPYEYKEVQNQHEHERLGSDWHESPAAAAAHFQRLEADIAKAAAERNYSDRRMSEQAQREALTADRATDLMQGEIPVQPVRRKPGRKPKTLDS